MLFFVVIDHLDLVYDDSKRFCAECTCFPDGIITSFNYPGNYMSLETTRVSWRIQVHSGQMMEIVFIYHNTQANTNSDSCRLEICNIVWSQAHKR